MTMKKVENRKQNPTAEESKAAIEAQMPLRYDASQSPASVQRVNSFKQLAKVSRPARMAFGGNSQWLRADMLFNPDYRDGLESPPFIITRAFKYNSKILGERFGIEIALSNGRFYNVGFPFNEGDSKRVQILDMFAERNASPFGPVVLHKLDLGKGNDYYDIVPFDQESLANADVEIPFAEMSVDPDIPF